MKVVQINAVFGKGSTGKICASISEKATAQGMENYILYSVGNSISSIAFSCAKKYELKIQALKSKIFGNYGLNSKRQTRRIIQKLHEIAPDVVHLHNIHGHDCHLGLLFDYLRKTKTKVIWTFHDCWAFTGYCPHYDMIKCQKWKSKCCKCPQRKRFSFFFDRSSLLFQKKKELFTSIDLTIITPSQWLANQVKQSFLRAYPVKIINNGIDLEIFKPTKNDFRKKHNITEEKKIVLGVAFGWGVRKGLDVFVELAKRLDSEKYQIVLVGTSDQTDTQLPESIISIHKTNNQMELAQIYTAADILINPTREDTFPTVNIESLACGTPVLTFKTGGSPEILDEKCGSVVESDDVVAMEKEIIRICSERPYSKENCVARAKKFDMNDRFDEYIQLYKEVLSE